MSLKKNIQQIFKANSEYANPGQAVNQASSLNTLSADLYTDSKRFIYELLQNADDSTIEMNSIQVWITTIDDYLVVAHSGKPFDSRDVQGICNVNNGTKKSDQTKTGYKGIGFKAVFGQSDNVAVFSNGEFFRFDSAYNFDWTWSETKKAWEKENDRSFQFPWQIIPIYTEPDEIYKPIVQYLKDIGAKVATIIKLRAPEETKKAIEDLSKNLNMFLFLKNISKIDFAISKLASTSIDRTEKNRITLRQVGIPAATWLVKNISLSVPKKLKEAIKGDRNIPEKLLNTDTIELSLAAKIKDEGIAKLYSNDRLLYSYLPTDERRYSFPVLVNSAFLTTANRETLHADSKWNQWLFRNIAIEIFTWIAELVSSEFQYQAYRLIPDRTFGGDSLGIEFNNGIDEALKTIPFISTKDRELISIGDTIVDFTLLSEKDFVGSNLIRNFISPQNQNDAKNFAANTGFEAEFRKLGASTFEWKDFAILVSSDKFKSNLTMPRSIELVKHLKRICEAGDVPEISTNTLRNLPFLRDHKNELRSPTQVCLPAPDDKNWDNQKSNLSFLHPDLLKWLVNEPKIRDWLQTLGVIERTDVTYITQTILPQIESYITLGNAVKTIQELFILYRKGELKEELIGKLSRIKLLTQNGLLRPAVECFLGDSYSPRLQIEEILNKDIFVSKAYCVNTNDKDEWRRFFKMLGVKDSISVINYSEKYHLNELTANGILKEYFEADDKKFTPAWSTFTADSYQDLISLTHIKLTLDNPKFAVRFWSDFIGNNSPETINLPATAFWGRQDMQGRIAGDKVKNYVEWFVTNQDCIPVATGKCRNSSFVFLNTNEISSIAGKYLPVFDGPELSPDWKSFFGFRTYLELQDYLDLLSNIALDVEEDGRVRSENRKRVQAVYSALLDECANWSESEISLVNEWSKTAKLLNSKYHVTRCLDLKYFVDGNESVFQDQFDFLSIKPENRKHPNLQDLLTYFNIKILRQSDFELIHSQETVCSDLINHLKAVIPFFKIWIEYDSPDENTIGSLSQLDEKRKGLQIYQSDDLRIQYQAIGFIKSVNVHFDKKKLHVTSPWNANSVLLKLSENLCNYFLLRGHDKKLDFLLRSTTDEILKYFEQEGINVPDDLKKQIPSVKVKPTDGVQPVSFHHGEFDSFAKIEAAVSGGKLSPEYFHLSQSDFDRLKYVESLIARSVENVIRHLKTLREYDCENHFLIANSIIGGITKNGNPITIVARPSDGNQVLLYYASEFDVLEYVDAEFWYEDGISPPRQMTFGLLLRQTEINRIPIKHIGVSDSDLESVTVSLKSDVLDFSAVPYVPQRIAMIVSSYANTQGGRLIFGVKEIDSSKNEITGLSNDFRVVEITNKAISLLSPIPTVTYGWTSIDRKLVFVIDTEKSDIPILLNNEKYVRRLSRTVLEEERLPQVPTLNAAAFRKTIAIIIAIENYAPRSVNQVSSVKYATEDAMRFKDVLIKSMRVDESDIHLWIDENALKSSLEYDLRSLFYSLEENDRLVFYYVGHGFHNGVSNFLSTYDVHQSNIAGTAISLRSILLDPLLKSKCKNALIFIDACAKSFQDEQERNLIGDIDDEEFKLITSEFPYYGIFFSCQPTQSSYSSDELKNGIWTYHLAKALGGEVPQVIKGNKYITDTLLRDYLLVSVTKFTKEEQGRDQNPKAILDSSCENVIVTLPTRA